MENSERSLQFQNVTNLYKSETMPNVSKCNEYDPPSSQTLNSVDQYGMMDLYHMTAKLKGPSNCKTNIYI
jgi:hypothetical protein